MRFLRFLVFLLLPLSPVMMVTAFAQACGGSTNHIFLYVRNGKSLVDPRFELISVSPTRFMYADENVAKFISKTLFPDDRERTDIFWRIPQVVKPDHAEKFIKSYKFEDYDPAPRWRRLSRDGFSGPVKDGMISLPTSEMYDFPLLLKIYANNLTPVYILGGHLGGCDPAERIILDGPEVRAYSEQWRPPLGYNKNL